MWWVLISEPLHGEKERERDESERREERRERESRERERERHERREREKERERASERESERDLLAAELSANRRGGLYYSERVPQHEGPSAEDSLRPSDAEESSSPGIGLPVPPPHPPPPLLPASFLSPLVSSLHTLHHPPPPARPPAFQPPTNA